jgi:uncharacterized surface protein with fasciclin (FAS1) repeats
MTVLVCFVMQAFAAVLAALNTTLADIDPAVLTPVLQYHVCAFTTVEARDDVSTLT